MRVIALRNWRDLKEGVRRLEGDVFTVSKERYEEIMAVQADLVAPYEQAPEPTPDEAAKAEAPKRTTRKRATAKKNG